MMGGNDRQRRKLLRAATVIGAGLPLAAPAQPSASASVATATPRPPTLDDADFYPPVRSDTPLRFPRDHGAHPAFRTEWWYLTGWLRRAGSSPNTGWLGMQITFFRSRTRHSPANPSRFAPTQLLLAHAALALPERGRLLHAQRAARIGFGLAAANEADTALTLGDWSLRRDHDDLYHAQLNAAEFTLDLRLRPPAPPVLQGEHGFSRKGPLPEQASHYYSRPQTQASGTISIGRQTFEASGATWIDHEWSSEILDRNATGWDWVGLNFDDGSALMAFRIRHRDGSVAWRSARWIDAAGRPLAPDPTPNFEPLRHWSSPRTGTRYPVAMAIDVGPRRLMVQPLFDDQELDARGSTGTLYWEGAVSVFEDGRRVGRGYLELTGYAAPLRM